MIRKRKWKKILLKSGLFDHNYYLFTYPDVRKNDIDPINHYIDFGAFEGRNPSASFNTIFYLENYPDVKESLINPLLHYILYGQNEKRLTLPTKVEDIDSTTINLNLTDEEQTIYDRLVEPDGIDEKWYLTTYPDIKEANINPTLHFMKNGWKEQRNPNDTFDTSFYLQANPDITEAGINPFYHYLQNGKIEGRLSKHPAGYKKSILDHAFPLKQVIRNWTCELPEISDNTEFFSFLNNIQSNKIVVSVSHDRYIDHVGGVQLCISDEQKELSEHGFTYININPACPLPILAENDNWHGDVIIGNNYIGTYLGDDILTALKNSFSGTKKLFFVTHALHGHSVSFLKSLHEKVEFSKSFFWIHDYFSICQNYNLLRNNLAYCGAPALDSQACNICIYGEDSRREHISKIQEIFKSISFTVLAPSQTAKNLWLNSTNLPYEDIHVHTHRNIIQDLTTPTIKLEKGQPLRIAFIGHTALHKGWFVFKELVEKFDSDSRYEFYHLGIKGTHEESLAKYIEVKNTWDNMKLMEEAIKEYNIHVSFLWSIWPETYNIVTYEALASGSTILTNKNSGNIAEEISLTKQGLVIDSEKELFDIFSDGTIRTKIDNIFVNNLIHGTLESSNITSEFIKNGDYN